MRDRSRISRVARELIAASIRVADPVAGRDPREKARTSPMLFERFDTDTAPGRRRLSRYTCTSFVGESKPGMARDAAQIERNDHRARASSLDRRIMELINLMRRKIAESNDHVKRNRLNR